MAAQNFKKYGQHSKQEPAVKLKVQKELDGDIEKSRLISHGRHRRAQAPDPYGGKQHEQQRDL